MQLDKSIGGVNLNNKSHSEIFEHINKWVISQKSIDRGSHDSIIEEWLFAERRKERSSLTVGQWQKYAYKSLTSYSQLLEKIIVCYRDNYVYFKSQSKHTIEHQNNLVPYQNVKKISRNNFNWLMHNADQLTEVPSKSGIQYRGKNYLPCLIESEINRKSVDLYENRIIISFLYTVLLNAIKVCKEIECIIKNEKNSIKELLARTQRGYHASIITQKVLSADYYEKVLSGRLKPSVDFLQQIYGQYKALFNIQEAILTALPRKTNTFREVRSYALVFQHIAEWFQYGEYSLKREKLIIQVKSIDKIFEYYCLLSTLKLLHEKGYEKESINSFSYSFADGNYQQEKDIPNTYTLINNRTKTKVTLYYQPVISARKFENDIRLYRTNSKRSYYTPDFVLKFNLLTETDKQEEYVIFDAKFSRRCTIEEFYLPEIIQRYSASICVAGNSRAPKMVWALQGRVEGCNTMWKYHNSCLAKQYKPITSYGILSINTLKSANTQMWNEIKDSISFL